MPFFCKYAPAADALYNSPYEPWSEFLTGRQERAPVPYYDPLKFAVQEAHRRGLELHAWFNPFRASHFAAKSGFAPSHVKNRKPRLVVKYGRYYWLDPGLPEARQYSMKVILDVAHRYDIDGVHLDDYFYPYAELGTTGVKIPFPDSNSYKKYVARYGPINKDDWRRQNINRFVKELHSELHKVKPHIRFGIAPFGIWQPGYPAQIRGYNAYANIYADARKWLRQGWVDYLSPQLYWSIEPAAQSFPALLSWWQKQNIHHRHLWPGLYTNRIGKDWNANQIIRQIRLTRKQKGVTGTVQFSMKTLMNNKGNIDGQLLSGAFSRPALVPATYWLAAGQPAQPHASLKEIGNQILIKLDAKKDNTPWLWVIKAKYGHHWLTYIKPGWERSEALPRQTPGGSFRGAAISVVNRLSEESAPQLLLPVLEQVEHKK